MTDTKRTPALAVKPDPKHPLRFPLLCSVKLDGIRIFMEGRAPKTRSLKELPNKHARAMLAGQDLLADLDMELIIGDPADPLCYNKTYRGVMTHAGEPEFMAYIFDAAVDGFTFEQRQEYLASIEKSLPPWCHVLQQFLITDQFMLDTLYARVTAEGHEGLILRTPKGIYKYGRSTAKEQLMLKLKPEEDSEFEILGFYEAETNLNDAFINEVGRTARSSHAENKVGNGMLGGFLARDIHTGVEFNCAPGKLEHDERREIWENQEKFKEKIGKYRHFPYGTIDDGKPRFPRWIGWRAAEDMDHAETSN